MEVAKGIHRETLGVVNWYLVEEGDKLTIVDAGTPKDWSRLAQAVAALGRRLEDVDAVLLTHAHSDHTGFAERARREIGVTVFIHQGDAERAKGAKPPKNEAGIGRYLLRVEAYRTLFGLLLRGGVKLIPIAEVSTFGDGETIDVPGRPRALHLPGHTAGMAALLFEDRSGACTGDALVTHNPLTGRNGPQIAPSGLNLDSGLALASLSSLEGIEADVLLPGHGDPWTEGAAEAVRRARAAGRS